MLRLFVLSAFLGLLASATTLHAAPTLFGYSETPHRDYHIFKQWVSVLERHLLEDTPEASCAQTRFNRCHLREWLAFLDSIRQLPRREQLQAVNQYANRKQYILDIDNYGVPDYWAVVHEFLDNGGDCEDYAITKLFSLRWLGYPMEQLRIVIVQDTNLRVPHAVLAVYGGPRILILDNQIDAVVDQDQVVHYVPVYAINELGWWLYSPHS